MALWTELASALVLSADIRSMRADDQHVLLNPRVLSINKDPLKVMGTMHAQVSLLFDKLIVKR